MMIQGQVSGKQLKKWIQFHVDNDTEHTVAALKLRRYLNVGDKKKYFVTPCDLIGKGGVVEGVSLDIRAIKS